ncbi:MAG: hypothetical protein ACREV9_08600 [Burkholderiales bacterium]
MNSTNIVQKLWNYCNILRDDGLPMRDCIIASDSVDREHLEADHASAPCTAFGERLWPLMDELNLALAA